MKGFPMQEYEVDLDGGFKTVMLLNDVDAARLGARKVDRAREVAADVEMSKRRRTVEKETR